MEEFPEIINYFVLQNDRECRPGRECRHVGGGRLRCDCRVTCPDSWKPVSSTVFIEFSSAVLLKGSFCRCVDLTACRTTITATSTRLPATLTNTFPLLIAASVGEMVVKQEFGDTFLETESLLP